MKSEELIALIKINDIINSGEIYKINKIDTEFIRKYITPLIIKRIYEIMGNKEEIKEILKEMEQTYKQNI